jgi:hypothetical protein
VRDGRGQVVATLCGIDRSSVQISDGTIAVLEQLATVIAAHLGRSSPRASSSAGAPRAGWAVGDEPTGDLTSAMVLADLLAASSTRHRPAPRRRAARRGGPAAMSVKQLEHALAARVVVEQAIGVLTERQHSSPRQAFERLRKVAARAAARCTTCPAEIVMSATDPGRPLPPELAGRR